MEEPKLQPVFVVLSYLVLLLVSLLQAAPQASAAYRQEGQVGDSRLQLTADIAPRSGQRFALTITSPTLGGQLHLVGAALFPAAAPGAAAAGQGRPVPLALWRQAPGVYDLNVRPLVPGRWSLLLAVQGATGTSNGTIALQVENPPQPPAWLLWRMGLLTLALLVYASLCTQPAQCPGRLLTSARR
jgi:hypothetical protein